MGMMRDYLSYDGVLSSDFNVFISGSYTYVRPERDKTFQSVPGRSGDLIYDNGRYKNVAIQYPAFIRKDFPDMHEGFANEVLKRTSYKRLYDTYHPDEYRLAIPTGALKPTTGPNNVSGRFTIEFNCKPQRYLISGDEAVKFTASGTLTNPTRMESKPIIRVYGYGTIGLGSGTLTIAEHGYPYMDIDCDLMDAHYGAINLNAYLTMSFNEYPTLAPGPNNFVLSGVDHIEVTPRWYRL